MTYIRVYTAYSLHLHLSNSILNFSSFEKWNYAYVEFQSAHQKTILDKKFSYLLNSNLCAPPTPPLIQNSVVHLSSHPLTDSQHNLLSLGINFSCTSKVSIPDLVAPIEHSFKSSKISPH